MSRRRVVVPKPKNTGRSLVSRRISRRRVFLFSSLFIRQRNYFSSFRWPSGKCFRAFTACSIPNLIKHESNRNLVSAERSGGSKAVARTLHPSVRKVCAACCSTLPPVTPRQNNRRLTLSGAFPIQTTLPHNRHCNTKFLCTLVATSNCFPSK